MFSKTKLLAAVVLIISFSSLLLCSALGSDKPYIFGMLMVGPYNDKGWSQAHYEGGKYVEEKIYGTKMIYIDKVNPADRPGVTISQLVDDMVEKGARLIIANSDDMKDGIREAALMHPEIFFIHISGDDVLTGRALKNLSNLMGKMIYGKMMAGFTAAMTTKTGKIGFLGALINEETCRHVAASYLGAKYAWEKVLKRKPDALKFKVTWIGFWFNIPGVTADPTQVAQNFFNTGYDVVISGIDTTEAIVVADQMLKKGKEVWTVHYDYIGVCQDYSDACLGVPYYNWGPSYIDFVKEAMSGNWKSKWVWAEPDWKDINNHDTSPVGFFTSVALSSLAKKELKTFINDLGSNKINLFSGPIKYQDGKVFVKAGNVATDKQIWYMKQLPKGIQGQSVVK